MPDCMMPFPEDWHDFLKDYSFDDSQEVYTNGSRLIPVFRVEQLIKHLLKAQEPITGETSDGYHTFNELYHHRAVLFSVIVANYPDRAWKSKKHHDGTMYDGMFIVGIDTPDGQATYHYDVDPYWDMFKCRVLDKAPEWDGHTPAQAIERIGRLKAQEPVEPKKNDVEMCGLRTWDWACPVCNTTLGYRAKYCSGCGQAVKWE